MLIQFSVSLVFLCWLTEGHSSTTVPTPVDPKCYKASSHAQPSDSNFHLSVVGDPDLFLPGELYTVSLQGVDSGQGPTPFTGFTIWAEVVEDESEPSVETTVTPGNKNLSQGLFQAYDAQTKAHEFCKSAVDNATAHPKTEVQVIWNAPTIASGMCIRICAKIGPRMSADKWSILARKICAASVAPASFPRQPPIVEPCCACDEAKYEVTFEGLWSRNTHPREFPPESARAHFGDVIGASHTAQYRVWQEGRVASTGLKRLADDGTTTSLEKELKAESDHIRTIIKARGISWQQVAGQGNPSTFAVFRVDAKHHLVSLAAKLAPSPDWIVGVSALELCNTNCTWTMSTTLPLYPYDAGTDSGISYTTRRKPTSPAAPVRALRPDWPRDARSPFFSTNGEMRPFARLRLTRLRLYEKNCDGSEPGNDHVVESAGVPGGGGVAGSCATHTWEPWGPCSVTCGEGRASRQRQYIWPTRAYAEACRVVLTDYKTCRGPRMHCRAVSEYEPEAGEAAGPCGVSAWAAWSPCAGCGVRARSRHYLAPRAHKRCHLGYRARTPMSQAMPCDAGPCYKPPEEYTNATNFDWFYVDKPRPECPVTAWGEWSPCSARCGRGRRLRTRLYVTRDSRVQRVVSQRLLAKWNQRYAELQGIEVQHNITASEPEVETKVQELFERCQFTLSLQEALCDSDEACHNITISQEICKHPVAVGHCRSYQERWFYDSSRGVCEPFGFSGCGGNANNFRSREECQKVCVGVPVTNKTGGTVDTTAPLIKVEEEKKINKATPSNEDNEVLQNDAPRAGADVDCKVSPWSGWSLCFGNCHSGIKLKFRQIDRVASSLGQRCSHLVKSRNCKPPQCQKAIVFDKALKYHDLN